MSLTFPKAGLPLLPASPRAGPTFSLASSILGPIFSLASSILGPIFSLASSILGAIFSLTSSSFSLAISTGPLPCSSAAADSSVAAAGGPPELVVAGSSGGADPASASVGCPPVASCSMAISSARYVAVSARGRLPIFHHSQGHLGVLAIRATGRRSLLGDRPVAVDVLAAPAGRIF